MAVGSVNSYQGTSVLIQSTTNRQRIDEQSRHNNSLKDSSYASKVSFEQRYPEYSSVSETSDSENVYAEAQSYQSQRSSKSAYMKAYTAVSDHERKESLSSKMGISVYA